MSKIKENPIKFVQLFSIIYLVAYAILRVIYNIVVSAVYELQYFDFVEVLGIIISLIPITLFLIYTYKFYGTKKTQILLPISYIVSLALSLFSFIQTIGYSRNYTLYILFGHTVAAVLTFILKVIGLGISVFLLVDCFTNFKYLKTSKKLVIIGAFISFIPALTDIIFSAFTNGSFTILNVLSCLMNLIGILSCLAYIIFWNFAVEKRNVSPLEKDLISIKQQFENGVITEEQYNQKRTEILNQL